MKMGQEKSNSRLPLLVAFLLGACITFLLFRLGDVYGFAIPLDTGGSSSDGRPASPVPVLVPAPPGYRPPTATDEPVLVPAPPSPPRLPTPVNTSIAPVPTTTPPPIRQISALRLKKDIWPKYYNLSLQVFLPGYEMPIPAEHKYKFLGRLIFFFENKKPLKRIVLNQRDLDIHRCNLTTEQGTVLPIKEIKRDNHLEFVTFELSEELPPGTHRLYVESMGQMERNNKGLYLSRHNEFESKSPYVAITQMEPADARAMVPCLDEPEYKAVWKVSVTHPKGTIALGNEAEESVQQEEDEWMLTKFATTPLMSSYLVAIFVGNYSYLEGNTGRGLRVRTYAPYELLDETHWALEVAIKAMDTYEKIYKIPYPLKKLDMIYVADFEAGAMENWGLVTYRGSAILYHKTRYRKDNKKYVADVVAHELGHQWFGNLVTTAWWSHLWLNEGWATFTEFVGTETAFNSSIPDYEYYLGNMKTAMDIDKCPDRGRPMVYELENHDAITDIMFNALTYERGSAFLAMLHELLGSDVFDQGVVNYLEKHQYKNTRQVDFFRELDAVVPAEMRGPDGKRLNVTTFGLKYTLQKGFPVVSLVPHNKTHVRLFQQRFRANTNPDKQRFQHSPYGYKWDVPIFIQRGDNGREFYWLPAGRDLFVPKSGNETLVVNADSFVYAVTNYTDSHWKDIGRHLNANHKIYSNKTRTRLMFEVGELFQRGLLSPETVVDIGAYLFQNEQEYLPFATFLKSFRGMEHVYSSQVKEASAKFLKAGLKARVKEMDIRETASRIVDSESFAKERLPLLLYTVYCEAAPADCQADLAQIFAEDFLSKCQDNQMASECSTVPVEIRTLVYCEGVRSGDDAVAEMIMKMGKFEKRQAEVESLLLATLCSRSKKVVWKSLATLGVKNPTNATSLLVDGGLNAPLVADDILETFYEKKAVHENAASRTGPPRRFRKFGSNVQYETAEKLRKAISKAVDRGQKTMGDIDVERGRQLAAALEKKAQEFGFL